MAVFGAVGAWVLAALGDKPAGPSDTGSIAIAVGGIALVFISVLGFGLYQDAALQGGVGRYEPRWRPTTIARIALIAAFLGASVHAFRIADLISRMGAP